MPLGEGWIIKIQIIGVVHTNALHYPLRGNVLFWRIAQYLCQIQRSETIVKPGARRLVRCRVRQSCSQLAHVRTAFPL